MTLSALDSSKRVEAIGEEWRGDGSSAVANVARVLGLDPAEVRQAALDAGISWTRDSGITRSLDDTAKKEILAFAATIWSFGYFAGTVQERES